MYFSSMKKLCLVLASTIIALTAALIGQYLFAGVPQAPPPQKPLHEKAINYITSTVPGHSVVLTEDEKRSLAFYVDTYGNFIKTICVQLDKHTENTTSSNLAGQIIYTLTITLHNKTTLAAQTERTSKQHLIESLENSISRCIRRYKSLIKTGFSFHRASNI